MASAVLRDELDCCICLDIFRDPVTLRCGHNFCRDCIDRVLDTQDESGVYTCPECREEFQERPALMRNLALRNIMENFLFTQPKETETRIFCTYCVDTPVPSIKSCLHCEASLCEKHLSVHSKSSEHVLSDPSTSLENRKCSVHKELLEYYCFEDATPICSTCYLFGGHKRHQVDILDEASEKKKEILRNVLQELTTQREDTDQRVRSLQNHKRDVQGKAAHLTERVTTLFTNLKTQLNDLEERVLSEISRQEEQMSFSVSDLIKNLETKTEELTEKIRHLQMAFNIQDSLAFLRELDSRKLWEDKPRGDVMAYTISDLDEGLISDTLHKDLDDIMSGVKKMFYVEKKSDDLTDPTRMASEKPDNASIFSFLPIPRLFKVDTEKWSLFQSREPQGACSVPAPSETREPFLEFESPFSSSRSENKGLFSKIPDVTLPKWEDWLKK
ncbi:E3 ubiquitin/ISG15 ligase TRIM25-like [Bufo gargarizans]|uniref:E3 ubiquitin/ISG15 ligase TRIM25-like n=1 Tax=Bufo gargarizans TaxID=30331 RepID=UPI001CF4105D|nr:E3 ubiquitin/ISG15 ligase TRIM25-like [Bufo gargarizans]